MPLRHKIQRKSSANDPIDDNERLLPAIELQSYQIDAIAHASLSRYSSSEVDTLPLEEEPQFVPQPLPSKQLRRIAASLKLHRCVDALKHLPRQHSRSQRAVVQASEEPECRDRDQCSSETLGGKEKRKRCSWKDVTSCAGSKVGQQSAINWYFWSSDTVKNCPTLEFVRTRLAPPNMWL